jgi:hypothetical protein
MPLLGLVPVYAPIGVMDTAQNFLHVVTKEGRKADPELFVVGILSSIQRDPFAARVRFLERLEAVSCVGRCGSRRLARSEDHPTVVRGCHPGTSRAGRNEQVLAFRAYRPQIVVADGASHLVLSFLFILL